MIGRNWGSDPINFSSTARLAARYRLIKSGASRFSTKEPPPMLGHPASAAEVKQNGNGFVASGLDLVYSSATSIALNAVKRVIVS